jgi:hypothetical protein
MEGFMGKASKHPKRRIRTHSPGIRRPARKSKLSLREIPAELDRARLLFMDTRSVRGTAHSTGVSASRLRRLIHRYKLAKWNRKRRKWTITDRRVREVVAYTTAGSVRLKLRGFSRASLAMRHRAAVNAFSASNEVDLLVAFQGASVTDVSGKKHNLETRPNVLLRRANAGGDADMKIYRLID